MISTAQRIDVDQAMARVASDLRRVSQYGLYNGRIDTPAARHYIERCSHCDTNTGTRLLFTRDYGYHTSGWWKNPDYEHCLHLSLSFRPPGFGPPAQLPKDDRLTGKWIELFFGDWQRLIWAESPFSSDGKKYDVWHYRVFTTPDFKTPILPRGEVYSRELTERGWLSYSDLGYTKEQAPATGSGTAE